MPRYIRIIDGIVDTVRNGVSPIEGEIESETGECGQILQPNGTFITPEPVIIEHQPTIEEQIAQLKTDNLILMDALATTFEELLILQDKIDILGGTV